MADRFSFLDLEMIVSYNGRMRNQNHTALESRGPGRPREFDMDAVVDGAIRIFRERGYHATSVGDLGDATGLTAGSLYKAFGDKRGVFIAALERYVGMRHAHIQAALDAESSGRNKIRAVLAIYADVSFGTEGRQGCLVLSSAMALTTFDDDIAQRIEASIQRTETLLQRLVREGQKDGSVSQACNAKATARTLLSVLQGFRVIGKFGRTREDMRAAVDATLRLLD